MGSYRAKALQDDERPAIQDDEKDQRASAQGRALGMDLFKLRCDKIKTMKLKWGWEKIEKLEKLVFLLLVFLIPCNLGKHWPQSWSYVNAILVDYLIPTFYLTDIIIIILLGLWLISIFKNSEFNLKLRIKKLITSKRIIFFFLIAVYCLLSIFNSKNQPAATYKLIKILEFAGLYFYIKHNINIKKDIRNIASAFSFSVIFQSYLAIAQWFKQANLFGYWFFGEQPYTIGNPGIKTISFFGRLKAPAMGTFPHPNVLAGFLVVSLFILLSLKPGRLPTMTKLIKNISLIFGTIALFFTFSLPAWIGFLISCLFLIIGKAKNNSFHLQGASSRLFKSVFKILFLILLLLFFYNGSKIFDPLSLERRSQLNKIAVKMWLSSPVPGIGLNNFIVRMEEFGFISAGCRFLQPVHNIYLLVLAETGIIGLIGLIWLIWLIAKKTLLEKNYSMFWVLGLIFFLGLFDHYWLTIQQGMLIMTVVLGII